jgi:nitrite reductase/ring-hydroxylating ferredoxin subunit
MSSSASAGSTAGTTATKSGSGTSASGAMPTGTLLGDVSEIPVGEGKVFTAEKVVVTQPVKGEYKAFSAVCTHVGCIVDKVAGGEIYCPCHGAIFKVTNGAAVAGPTSVALPAKKIEVTNGKITLL